MPQRPRVSIVARPFAALLLLGLAGGSSGCLLAAGAAVGAKFGTGNAEGVVDASPEAVAEAARAVLEDSGFTLVEDKVTGDGEIEIEGVTAYDRKARLNIEAFGDGSRLSVRLGLLGDKDESSIYFDRIKQRAE